MRLNWKHATTTTAQREGEKSEYAGEGDESSSQQPKDLRRECTGRNAKMRGAMQAVANNHSCEQSIAQF